MGSELPISLDFVYYLSNTLHTDLDEWEKNEAISEKNNNLDGEDMGKYSLLQLLISLLVIGVFSITALNWLHGDRRLSHNPVKTSNIDKDLRWIGDNFRKTSSQ